VPEPLARLLDGRPAVGRAEQAFPFLTVDDAGFPHVALLSRAEIGVSRDGREVLAVIASQRTRANLERDGRAGLIAIEGTTAHYAKLTVTRTIKAGGLAGCAMNVAGHKADSLGIPLTPVTFTTTEEIARLENWDAAAGLLARLDAGEGQPARS
jgi:hypothetical protein